MSDSSLSISAAKASRQTELERDGLTIEVTFTAYPGSPGSARITNLLHYLDGYKNSSPNAITQALISVLSSIKDEATPKPKTNTPRSHYGCWCNSYKKRDTKENSHAWNS